MNATSLALAAALPGRADAASVTIIDDVLDPALRASVAAHLNRPTWAFGWKSDSKSDVFSFWHKHFAGSRHPDHLPQGKTQYDCADELARTAPDIHAMWTQLAATTLDGHVLQRCYANGAPYGSEGTVHTDSLSDRSFTAIYFPHDKWDPNWGGETLFLDRDKSDVVAAVYPRPNRMVTFPGTIPHVARGVSRTCPVMRVTLMFKTERRT